MATRLAICGVWVVGVNGGGSRSWVDVACFFFGNGFSDRRDLLGNQSDGGGGGGGGWFRCWHNNMLRSSVCDCLILFLGWMVQWDANVVWINHTNCCFLCCPCCFCCIASKEMKGIYIDLLYCKYSSSGFWCWGLGFLVLGFEYFCWGGLSFQENFFNFLLLLVLIFFFFGSLLCCLRIENLITQKLHLNSKSHCRNLSLLVLLPKYQPKRGVI